ncbi:hypothetical protein LXD69_16995 [Flavobacterium sediminilitoris]|uniref:Uncharacterized protein n=1 Tax=Flavobacterium sediminilitoris TaxID=2024526 RepID=A0ABY4HLI3_9FLAO|nr:MULTISPECIES: hypothetical protein [Flavobacterium]UOX33717.1 hypothetical protein LXD69_16995 [Flavobacterium sediminilitoris]
MKKNLFALLFTVVTTFSFAQNFTDLNDYPLSNVEDYKNAETKVVECATYLFSTPVKKDDLNRLSATQFILKWMEGSDYTFNIDSKMTELTDGNTDLFGMYLAGMSKVVIESPNKKLNDDEIRSEVTNMLVAYCKDASNNVKATKKLKQLMRE